MFEFYLRIGIYFFCFLLALFGMSALDFNRFLKQDRVVQAQVLYFVICCALSYLMGNFMIALMYRFYKG